MIALIDFLTIALASSTPLLLAGTGGLISERSGIVNIALEGKMLFGALLAVVFTYWSGNPWIGCLGGALAGVLLAWLHLSACQYFGAEHVVSGAAINILSIGLTGFLVFQVFSSKSSEQVATLPTVAGLSPLFFLGLLAVAVFSWSLKHTRYGLHLSAAGEAPEVAEARGVNVARVRLISLTLSGILAGLAGVQLALGEIGFFTEKMSTGRGFIALAAVIFGRWRPWPMLLACLFFGFADAGALRLKLVWQALPDELAQSIPFILTLVVLGFSRASSGMPMALGKKVEQRR